MLSRREVLQGLIVSLGGASSLTACGGLADVVATTPASTGRFYTERELALVSRLSELIIPRTETPGALDVNVPGYMDGLMTDWASETTRNRHRRALGQLDRNLGRLVGGDFVTAPETVAVSALAELDAAAFNEPEDEDRYAGYRNLKGYVTQAYFATEGGAREELKWIAVPGRWDPAVQIVRQ